MNAKYNETRFQVPQDSSSSESTSFTEFARALSRSACFQKRVSFLSLSLSVLKNRKRNILSLSGRRPGTPVTEYCSKLTLSPPLANQ